MPKKTKEPKDLEFWGEERFLNRSIKISGLKGEDATEIPVPDNEIVCDFCNAEITEFPVPVYLGNALCPKCFQGLGLKENNKKER